MRLQTAESVTIGHPDKLCDQISDTILDNYLARDPHARTAVETLASSHGVTVAGEINSTAVLNDDQIERIVRAVIQDVGYTRNNGYDPETIPVRVELTKQSPEIANAVNQKQQGAGDQGIMYGYATDETPELMPLPVVIARTMTRSLEIARSHEILPWLRPDGKAQVTVAYDEHGMVKWIDNIVISVQHDPGISRDDIRHGIYQNVLEPFDAKYTIKEQMLINPSGEWTLGGPATDTGLTGRKLAVDTYGGLIPHGGGAFSGKDPSKVDRSGAYAARQAAVFLVKKRFAARALVQLSYAIGHPTPTSVTVDTFGTNNTNIDDVELAKVLQEAYDFTPAGIITGLDLLKPFYRVTAQHGHFGWSYLPWEKY